MLGLVQGRIALAQRPVGVSQQSLLGATLGSPLPSSYRSGYVVRREPAVQTPTICLNLIVKNETKVLARCLDSIVPFVDAWLIVDTGSTDGTQEHVRQYFASRGIPGKLVERPWRDFAHNRTEALRLARPHADYVWIIDADEKLEYEAGFQLPSLEADAYQLLHRGHKSTTEFYRTQLVRSRLPFRYQGVLHEVISCDEPHTTARIATGLVSVGYFDGARNADPVAKYRSDTEVLEKALESEPDNARYVFYLAQSYRDSNRLELAVATYERRVKMAGWAEEQWYAALQMAVLYERQGQHAQAINAYLNAFALRPTRAEPLCELARHYRERAAYPLGHLFARRAMEIAKPDDILFLDESVYSWRALDEFSICAYYVGDQAAGRDAVERLLAEGNLPRQHRARVEKNREFFAAKPAAK
jgi:glycosyltransferase involved in cell wall biosynthesis